MRLHGPRAAHGAKSLKDYEVKQYAAVAELRARFEDGRQVHPASQAATAYVNYGRWVVLCHECHGGAIVDVDHGVARCFECGAVYVVEDGTLILPAESVMASIETILSARSELRTRNWNPGETLVALKRENARHGVTAHGRR